MADTPSPELRDQIAAAIHMHVHTPDRESLIVDAVMPVVTAAQAEAWERAVAYVCEMGGLRNIGWYNPHAPAPGHEPGTDDCVTDPRPASMLARVAVDTEPDDVAMICPACDWTITDNVPDRACGLCGTPMIHDDDTADTEPGMPEVRATPGELIDTTIARALTAANQHGPVLLVHNDSRIDVYPKDTAAAVHARRDLARARTITGAHDEATTLRAQVAALTARAETAERRLATAQRQRETHKASGEAWREVAEMYEQWKAQAAQRSAEQGAECDAAQARYRNAWRSARERAQHANAILHNHCDTAHDFDAQIHPAGGPPLCWCGLSERADVHKAYAAVVAERDEAARLAGDRWAALAGISLMWAQRVNRGHMFLANTDDVPRMRGLLAGHHHPDELPEPDDDLDPEHLRLPDGRCVISVGGQGHLPCTEHAAPAAPDLAAALLQSIRDAKERRTTQPPDVAP